MSFMNLNEAVSIFVTANSAPGDTVIISVGLNGEAKPAISLKTSTYSEHQKETVHAEMDLAPFLPKSYRKNGESIGYDSWHQYINSVIVPAVLIVTSSGLRQLKKENRK